VWVDMIRPSGMVLLHPKLDRHERYESAGHGHYRREEGGEGCSTARRKCLRQMGQG